jgi:transcription elongation factor GreA
MSNKIVSLYSKVTVKWDSLQATFTIVKPEEINLAEKKISFVSPLGKSLLNKKEKEEIEVLVPSGKIKYQIVNIE